MRTCGCALRMSSQTTSPTPIKLVKCGESRSQAVLSIFVGYTIVIRSVSPKISRIGRQKRNSGFFFLFGQKNPFGELFSKMTSKDSISFFFLQTLQNLKIQPQSHQWRPSGLKFGTYLTCSYGRTKRCLKMSLTQCLWLLLSFNRD